MFLFKRFFSVLLIILLCFSLAGCKMIENIIPKDNNSIVATDEGTVVSKYSSGDISDNSQVSSKTSSTSSTVKNPPKVTVSVVEKTIKSDSKIELQKTKKLSNVNDLKNSHRVISESNYYQYSFLDQNGKTLYKRIDNTIKNSQSMVETSDLDISENDISKIFTAYNSDHPQYFYISKSYLQVYDSSGNQIRALLLLYSDGNVTDDYNNKLKLTKTADRNKIDRQITGFKDYMEEILASIPLGETEIIKERIIHDHIIDWVSYDEKVAESDVDYDAAIPMDYNVYGAAVERSAVCEGYSKLFQYLCYNVGINCTVVEGDRREFLHMWNAVCLEDEWYQIDLTWNDEERYISYDYFNLTSQEMYYDHKADTTYLNIPKCDAVTFSFINYFAVYEDGSMDAPESYKNELLIANKLPNKNIYIYIPKARLNPLGDVEITWYEVYVQNYIYAQNCEFMRFARENNIKLSNTYRSEGRLIVIVNN